MPKIDFLANMGTLVINPVSQVIGNGIFRAAVEANSQGLATFESEDYAVTVRGDRKALAQATIISSAFVTTGVYYGLRRINIAGRLQLLIPLIEYLDTQIKSLTGDLATQYYGVLDELASATDPKEVRKLQGFVQQLAGLIQNRAGNIAVVSDYIRYFDSYDLNPALRQSLINSTVPVDILDEVPELLALVRNPPLGLEDNVAESFKVMFGTTITDGQATKSAGAASDVARSARELVNLTTRVKPSDFVMGSITSVEDILEVGVAPPSRGELEALQTVSKQLSTSVDDFATGTTTFKASIRTGKIVGLLARANIVDLGWWIGSGIIDSILNWAGVPEEEQRIELGDSWFLNNIVEPLLDVSESAGTSFFDVFVLNPLLDTVFPEDLYAKLIEVATSDEYPTLAIAMYAVMGFFVDEVEIDGLIPITIGDNSPIDVDAAIPLPRIEPLDLLFYITIGCVAKVVFNGWVVPAWKALTTTTDAIA